MIFRILSVAAAAIRPRSTRTKDRSMTDPQIQFDDAAAYERRIGEWSKLVGAVFLDWLAPHTGLRWIDVGCGSGTFTELIIAKHAPAEVQGIDPSDAQLAFARARRGTPMAEFTTAMRWRCHFRPRSSTSPPWRW